MKTYIFTIIAAVMLAGCVDTPTVVRKDKVDAQANEKHQTFLTEMEIKEVRCMALAENTKVFYYRQYADNGIPFNIFITKKGEIFEYFFDESYLLQSPTILFEDIDKCVQTIRNQLPLKKEWVEYEK